MILEAKQKIFAATQSERYVARRPTRQGCRKPAKLDSVLQQSVTLLMRGEFSV